MPLSGILADDVSWESVFYVFGALGCIWFVFWAFLCFDSPVEHPRISQVERDFVVSRIPSENEGKDLPFPPLKEISTSIPVMALAVAHVGQSWGFYTLLTETPTYLSNIQHFSMKAVR